MNATTIYQTLQDRNNVEEVQKHGPYFCSLHDENGEIKKGTREPWLGPGYYFWDTYIEDAQWWGENIYGLDHYLVFESVYDSHSELLFDTVGDLSKQKFLVTCAESLKAKLKVSKVSFPKLLNYLEEHADFKKQFKAIRVWPLSIRCSSKSSIIYFPNMDYREPLMAKVQICFFDSTLLTAPFVFAYRPNFSKDYTV